MKTLKLFNAVVEKKSDKKHFVSEDGYVIESGALWAKTRIVNYYKKEALNGNDLNKTFHKSWKKIKDSTRGELLVHQILHYLTTYGTGFQMEAYIPNEIVKLPKTKIVFKVIKAYTKEELINKALRMLKSGIALKEETVNDLLSVLVDDLDYKFTGDEGIKNKEAVVKIADLYGVIPNDFMGFFRYILYRATESTLIIKNKRTIETVQKSSYNPAAQFKKFGLAKVAEHFNRFKPLFLAFKSKCPKVINKISKLSKTNHKPMVQNALNLVTQRKLTVDDNHWLANATLFALFKALNAVHLRLNGQNTFLYKIRNGKSYAKESKVTSVNEHNYNYLIKYLKGRFSFNGKKIFIPEDVVYALPTSEKMFVGNIPMGSKFYGNKLAVGIYWKNSGGARDLDLSSINVDGKVGWNRSYYDEDQNLMFSGDITNAPDGAVEYLHAKKGVAHPTIVMNNVYSFSGSDWGEDTTGKTCKYKIIIGRGDRIDRKFMMNPNNLFMETNVESVQEQSIIGLFLQEGKRQAFVVLNFGAGQARVSGGNEHSATARVALTQEWSNSLSFNTIVEALGAKIVQKSKDADIDLSLNTLERDSFIKIFESKGSNTTKQKVLVKV
ncbi:MAG: hypothetical protein V3U54_07810 [Thermodesulfobacteriota bacterium]